MLQLAVLVLQLSQLLGFSAVHPAVLRFPAIVGLFRDAVLPAQFRGRQPRLSLLQYRDDLLFTVSCAFHRVLLSPGLGRNSHSTWHLFRGLGVDCFHSIHWEPSQ